MKGKIFSEEQDVFVGRWISIEDELPGKECDVLGFKPGRSQRVLRFVPATDEDSAFFVVGWLDLEAHPTHWMPLPEPPIDRTRDNG